MRKPEPSTEPSLFAASPFPAAELSDEDRLACLRLIRSDNIGPVTFRELISHFGNAKAALAAVPDLSKRGGRTIRICGQDAAEAELARAQKIGARALFVLEPDYPAPLAALDAPPPLIYVKGDRALLGRPTLAIVGSRQCSAAGAKLARRFADDLSRAGYVIASGLARGIDSLAHSASLARGTVAVLAGGLDIVYPPEHDELQRSIGEKGALVSEMPPGFVPRGQDFPRRNRIISGLSLGVLVIEAARRSGTLVTARLANEQGREVFAIPGHPLDPRAEGTNALLKKGATLVTEPADVLGALTPLTRTPGRALRDEAEDTSLGVAPPPLTQSERDKVVAALGPVPVDVDAVVRTTGLTTRAVQVVLLELALAGRLERHGSGLVSLLASAG